MDQQAFEDHALWATVAQVEQQLVKTDGDAPAAETEPRERLRFLIAYTRSFQELGAAYFNTSMLQGALNIWASAAANFPGNGALWAADTLDGLFPLLGGWPQPPARGGAAAKANKLFAEYIQSAQGALGALRQELERATTQSQAARQEVTASLDTDRAAASQAVAELKAQLSGLHDEAEAMSARVTAEVSRLDNALTANGEAFTKAQAARSERYSAWLEEQGEALTEQGAPFVQRLDEYASAGREQLEALTKLRDDTEQMAGRAAAAVLARDYGSYAQREWVAGIAAYLLGFGVLIGLGAFLVKTLAGIGKDDQVSWQFVALKLGLTLTGAAAATVAFQFGSKSMQRATTNKRLELELRAIGPFLEGIDDPQLVRDAKKEFVDRTFGRAWETSESGEDVVSVATLDKVGDLVGKLVGVGKLAGK